MIARINELTLETDAANATIDQLRHDNGALTTKLEQAQDDLLAARAGLRRMIRERNTNADAHAEQRVSSVQRPATAGIGQRVRWSPDRCYLP
ncbi:hypothetical protein Ari01nite_94110 [Paractinoplanes rishiriensis]|uniref:Uncharacterized protein n=1 Tax=Paractinoplanes rishiriensis TaxID=1050105 RepID=A0A919MVZ7_9ACTN|nr:hypothetical protein Ari01nite_94110 [Actinoplanes rishiriensis]